MQTNADVHCLEAVEKTKDCTKRSKDVRFDIYRDFFHTLAASTDGAVYPEYSRRI